MRECPECGKQFSTGASYRVHKHRFHRAVDPEPAVLQQEPETTAAPEAEQDAQDSEEAPETQQRGGASGAGLAIGLGTLAAVALLAWFGRRKQ